VLEGGGDTLRSGGKQGGLRDKLGAFYRFTRPHTIRGTILASAMGVLRCLIEHPKAFTLQPVPRALLVSAGLWVWVWGGGGGWNRVGVWLVASIGVGLCRGGTV
jgi:hypothetical protein